MDSVRSEAISVLYCSHLELSCDRFSVPYLQRTVVVDLGLFLAGPLFSFYFERYLTA